MKNLFFIGPMGAGKSTIGRLLGKILKKKFIDTDTALEHLIGSNLQHIFDLEGEIGFRIRENRLLNNLTKKKNIILATGGGTILIKKNCKLLKSRGKIIYLKLSIEQQILRTFNSFKKRPLLIDNTLISNKKILKDIAKIRNPIYEKLADIIVTNNDSNIKSIIDKLLDLLD